MNRPFQTGRTGLCHCVCGVLRHPGYCGTFADNLKPELQRGLLARAELYLFTGDNAEARAALNEAMDIATRDPLGHMRLHVTDCHWGFARLALAKKKRDVARSELAKARALIEETGYHRRDAELTELEGSIEGPANPAA